MADVPFPKPQKWLKNAEAAELLAVDVRTIKRWVKRLDTREALAAVRHGKQWRIPRPKNLQHWRSDVRWRFKKLGTPLESDWKRALRKKARETTRYNLESYRLWLAAYMKVLERRPITGQDREACSLLRNAASRILSPLPRCEMEVERHKLEFPRQLASCGLAPNEVQAVMRYWPDKKHFRRVHAAHTLAQLEAIRHTVDYLQAARDLEQRGGRTPTTENIRPLLHNDLVAHINDTREQPPGKVVRHPTPEEMKRITLGSVYGAIAGKKTPQVTLDFRLPQVGLARRTAQKRYPQRQPAQRDIRAAVYRIAPSVPGLGQGQQTGKTPVRGPASGQRSPGQP